MMKRSAAGVVVGMRGAMLAACAGLATASASFGVNALWAGGAVGVYQEPANWSIGTLPALSDTIVMNTTPSMTVDFTDNVITGRLLHNQGNLVLNLNGFTLDLRLAGGQNSSWTSGVSTVGGGDVEINGGSVICNWVRLSHNFGATSVVIMDDPAASFETRDSMRVGSFANGTFSARAGSSLTVGNDLVIGETEAGDGLFTTFDDTTTVSVVDQVQIGALGDGVMRLNGGSLTCENFFISAFMLSTGEVYVTGENTLLDIVGGLSVGFANLGLLEVNGGSSVSAFQLRVGLNPLSDGTLYVQGANSLLTIGADAVVGSSGQGFVHIRNGGRADLGELTISGSEDAALVRVEGATSVLDVRDEFRVGSIGTGDMEIIDGGVANGDAVEIGGGGVLSLDNGTLNTTSLTVSGLGVGSGSARGLTGQSGVIGTGTISGAVMLEGVLAPGPDYSVISVNGSLTIGEDGILDIDFRAPFVGMSDADAVAVTGDVVLGGLLRAQSNTTVSPPLLQRLPIITGAASVSGMFDDAVIEQPISSGRWIIVSNGSDVELVATVVGDLTGDGVVDSSDLATLLAAWGSSDPNADFNDDGVVDSSDLATLLAAWG